MTSPDLSRVEMLNLYDMLTDASYATLDAEGKIEVCLFRRRLLPLRHEADDAIRDAQEKLAPDGWEEAREWLRHDSDATPEQRTRANGLLAEFNARIDEYVVKAISGIRIEEVKPLSLKIAKQLLDGNSEWSSAQIDLLLAATDMEG